jgi:GT2 family glycosyltransferase
MGVFVDLDSEISCARIQLVTDLAIIIVNYNVCELLRNCLRSVYESNGNITSEVCVVDNASTDGSTNMVSSEFPAAHLIANSENVGYPAGNNQGMRLFAVDTIENKFRYILLLNPDTEIPSDGLDKIIAYMDKHPEIGIIGPKLVLADGQLDLACRRSFPTPEISFYRMLGLSKLFPKSKRYGRYNMTYVDENITVEVDSVVGAFMMVRSSAVATESLMDERFWMYGEDLDWAKRIKDAGWKVVYYPEVTVLHIKRASSRQNKRAQSEFYRAMLIFYYKHYRYDTSRLLHWLVIMGIAVKGGPDAFKYIAMGRSILD